jgi:hypothetical protein
MGVDSADYSRPVSRIERVRCLSCAIVYVKPTGGGTVSANPGCPECGYLGWVKDAPSVRPDAAQLRSAGDPLQRRTG